MTVDEHAAARTPFAEHVRWSKRPEGARFRRRALAVGARSGGDLLDLGLAKQASDVLERVGVGYARADDARPVVVDYRAGTRTPAIAQLGQVLEDRDELDPLAGRGRSEGVQVAQRRNVRGLVEDEQ